MHFWGDSATRADYFRPQPALGRQRDLECFLADRV